MISACKQPAVTYFGVEEEYHSPKLMRLLCEYIKNVLLDHTTGDCSLCRHWALSKHALMEDLKVHTQENALEYFLEVYCCESVQGSTLSDGMVRCAGSRFESWPSCSSGGMGRIVLCITAMEPTLHNGRGTHS